MAHHKRKKARANQRTGSKNDLKRKFGYDWYWLRDEPLWWDVIHHRRPTRRANKRCEVKIMKGEDPDNIAWPLYKKPHIYYW